MSTIGKRISKLEAVAFPPLQKPWVRITQNLGENMGQAKERAGYGPEDDETYNFLVRQVIPGKKPIANEIEV